MLRKANSAALCGLDAKLVEVEVAATKGLRVFTIVGLPDTAVQEAKERVSTALRSCNLPLDKHSVILKKVLVNLAPADLRKEGAAFDLPIALALLAAANLVSFNPAEVMFAGELAFSVELRPIPGALSIAQLAQSRGFKKLFVPAANAAQAALVKELQVFGLDSLAQAVKLLKGQLQIAPSAAAPAGPSAAFELDFGHIGGQPSAKRALEIAAAGNHNLLMIGPPGSGKSFLAKALASILPPLREHEQFELTKIYSACGLLGPGQ